MKNILLITSSPRGEASFSSQVATEFAQQLGGNLTVRELWRGGLSPIDERFIHASHVPQPDRTPEQIADLKTSDELIAEVQAADILVIAAGMINFGMPAALKTWIDHITRGGVTFQYGEAGPEGLIHGKKVFLILASGGVYSAGPTVSMNHLEPPLKTNLGFLGMTDIETVWAEGVAYGPEAAAQAVESAKTKTRELAGSVA